MCRKLLVFFAGILLVSPLFADVKISYLSGSVIVFHENRWTAAAPNMTLDARDKIKTMAQSKALLTVDGTTRIWVGQNSEMELSGLGQESFFNLLAGRIKAKVKLLSGRKFKVQTPVCVASVRGTEFVIASEGLLQVIEGLVEFGDLLQSQLIDVSAGQIGISGTGGFSSREMTGEERGNLEQEWQGFGQEGGSGANNPSPQDGQGQTARQEEQAARFADLRAELHEVAQEMRNDIAATRELTNEIREADIADGRTLRDVHGNTVQVEQYLFRPDNSTIQILNLAKRTEYNYSQNLPSGWTYTGPTGSRLDVMDVRMTMNMPLPQQLTEWPSYISSRGDDLHPQTVVASLTNQEDKIEFSGQWKLKGQLDEKGETLTDDRLVFDSYINGWKVDPNYDPKTDTSRTVNRTDGTDADGSDTNDLWVWGISPDMKLTKDGSTKYVNLYTEGYVIDNSGSILNLNTFTETAENPFTLLRKVAGEHIVFCKDADTGTSFFARGNLDLVYLPNIVVSAAEKLATQISNLNMTSSNSGSGD